MRKAKIDELPQLINIIKGDMNFVGPRPEVEEYIKEESFSFLKRIKPGLTDLSSIMFSDEEKLISNMGGVDNYHKILDVKLDLIYHYLGIKNIWIDFQIILITIISLFNPVWARSHINRNFLATLSPEIVKKMHLIRSLNNRCY